MENTKASSSRSNSARQVAAHVLAAGGILVAPRGCTPGDAVTIIGAPEMRKPGQKFGSEDSMRSVRENSAGAVADAVIFGGVDIGAAPTIDRTRSEPAVSFGANL